MKALLVGLAILIAAVGATMTPTGSATTAAAAPETCMTIPPWGPGLPADFIPLPATGTSFDFTDACQELSDCYLDGTHAQNTKLAALADKFSCDQLFLNKAKDACQEWLYPDESFSLLDFSKCKKIRQAYYDTFRVLGWSYFRWCQFC